MEDALLRTLPVREPLGDQADWRAAKCAKDGPYQRAARHVHAAFGLAAGLQETEHGYPDWEVLLYMGRCLRKQQQAPANWLQHLARACHYGEREAGGVLLPVYSLHAARLRLLLGMASARRWAAATASAAGGTQPRAAEQQQGQQQASGGRPRQQKAVGRPPAVVNGASQQDREREVLAAAANFCFVPATYASLHSPSPSRGAREARPPAAAGDAELAAHWRCLVDDCCAAMEWCLDRDRSFHRAAHRCVRCSGRLVCACTFVHGLLSMCKCMCPLFKSNMYLWHWLGPRPHPPAGWRRRSTSWGSLTGRQPPWPLSSARPSRPSCP
jgi:hypothetical protein